MSSRWSGLHILNQVFPWLLFPRIYSSLPTHSPALPKYWPGFVVVSFNWLDVPRIIIQRWRAGWHSPEWRWWSTSFGLLCRVKDYFRLFLLSVALDSTSDSLRPQNARTSYFLTLCIRYPHEEQRDLTYALFFWGTIIPVKGSGLIGKLERCR